jgi:sulfatase maturation enzyme AslB (radical SAM superfamily)
MFLDEKLLKNIEQRRNSPLNRYIVYCDNIYRRILDWAKPSCKRLIVGITITEKCNLKCIYCYQKFKTDKRISFEKAQEIITYILNTNSIWTDVEFRLLGGEPFVESELVKNIIAWTFRTRWKKRCLFKIATNGTLLDVNTKKWIRQHRKRIDLILSLDGPPDVHNKNRMNSFYNIDTAFFKDVWPDGAVKMTVEKESISELFNSIVYVTKNTRLNVSFNLAGGQEWNESDLEIFKSEQEKLIPFYIKYGLTIPPIYNINFSRILNFNDSTRQCGIGKSVVTYDTEGNHYPCHLFLPNVIKDRNFPKIIDFSNDDFLKDEYCNACVLKNICPTCYSFNFVERGQSNCRDHNFCAFYEEIIKCAAKIKMHKYSKKLFLNGIELKEIEAILYLNKHIT